jgi:hypothetical protein
MVVRYKKLKTFAPWVYLGTLIYIMVLVPTLIFNNEKNHMWILVFNSTLEIFMVL